MEFGPHLMLALIEGAVTAAVLALTASGLSLVFGVMRVVNIAHGAFFMLGAVLAWWIAQAVGGHPAWGFGAALIAAPLMVGALAAAADAAVLRRLAHDPERTIVATIGLLYIIEQVTLMTYGPEARPVVAPFNARIALPWLERGTEGWAVIWPWGFGTTTYKLAVIGAAMAMVAGLWLFLARTRAGGDPLLLSFVVVIIGGLGSLPGTLLAAVLIGLSDGIISVFFSPTLAKIVATLMVALVLVFRPQGLFGSRPA
jgi:branched-chain amino acid transport system permease protein